MMKKITRLILIGLTIQFVTSCSKEGDTANTSSTAVTIENIAGIYKGSTLVGSTQTSSSPITFSNFTDPNFTFTVSYLGNDKCRLVISTIAPLLIKSFDLPLTNKTILDLAQGWTEGAFDFDNNNDMKMTIRLTSQVGVFSTLGFFEYQKSGATILFRGIGTR